MMPCALILGVSGQDGSYLAEWLLERGYRVIGTVPPEDPDPANDLCPIREQIEVRVTNLTDQENLVKVVGGYQPDEIYNFASQSHLIASMADPVATGEVSGLAVTRILEAIRLKSPSTRFFQASSSEMFGRQPQEVPQTEKTPFAPWNSYAAAKLYAHWIVSCYRRNHGLFACSGILYNHESPRRGPEFVTRKVTQGAAKIKLGIGKELHLGNLEARRDWGFAGDFVRAMWLMMQRPEPEDFILATGETHSVRDLCEIAFSHVDLDYRDHVVQDELHYRAPETALLVGNPAKARRLLHWEPAVSFRELVQMMVEADMASLRRTR